MIHTIPPNEIRSLLIHLSEMEQSGIKNVLVLGELTVEFKEELRLSHPDTVFNFIEPSKIQYEVISTWLNQESTPKACVLFPVSEIMRRRIIDCLVSTTNLPCLVQFAKQPEKVVIMSVYKAGTNLIARLMQSLGYQLIGEGIRDSYAEIRAELSKQRNMNVYTHEHLVDVLLNIAPPLSAVFLHQLHVTNAGFAPEGFIDRWLPEYSPPLLFHFRDPRAVCVSLLLYLTSNGDHVTLKWPWGMIHREILLSLSSTEERLDFIINFNHEFLESAFNKHLWLRFHPAVIQTNYEAMVGPHGGGSVDTQVRAVYRVMASLGATGDPSVYANTLYSKSARTFQTGQAYMWRNYFTASQISKFSDRYGDVLRALSYEIN